MEDADRQFADQQHNESDVGEVDPGLFPRKFETREMSGEQVDHQESTYQIAAGEHGDGDLAPGEIREHEKAAEEFLLHAIDAQFDLREGGHKHEYHRQGKEYHRESE